MFDNGKLKVFSDTGDSVKTVALKLKKKNVNVLELSNQSAGIYFLMFSDNEGNILQRSKLVKK